MSKSVIIEIDCPKCRTTGKMTQWEEIDVKEYPKFGEMSEQEKIFTYQCPKCGTTIKILHNLTYIDTDNSYIIRLLATDADYKEFENFDHIIENTKYSNMNLRQRVVTTIGELKQKIHILNSGFDDRVVEIIKVLQWQEAERKLNKEISEYNVSFLKAESGSYVFFSEEKRPIASVIISEDYYNAVKEKFQKEIEEYSKDNYIFDMQWAADILLDKMDETEKNK